MRSGHTSSAQPLMANPFTRNEGQLMFTRCSAGAALKDLNSCVKMKFGDKSLYVYRMMIQYVASCSV